MALRSRFKFARAKRLIALAGALLMAALIAIPVSSLVLAQAPPSDEIILVNADREFVERKGDGRFVARPLFNKEIDLLYYGVRHPDTSELLAGLFRVQDDGKDRSDGREYSWEYEKATSTRSSTRSRVTCCSCWWNTLPGRTPRTSTESSPSISRAGEPCSPWSASPS